MNKTLTYSLIALGVGIAGYFGYKKFFPKAEAVVEEQPQTRSGGGSMGTLPVTETTTAATQQTISRPVFTVAPKPIIQNVSPASFKPVTAISRPTIPVITKPATFTSNQIITRN